MKHSALSFSNVRDFAKMGLNCLVGSGMLMQPALTIGATGCVDGPSNAAPEIWVEIWNAYNDGDIARAQAAQDRASELTATVRDLGLHPAMKELLGQRLGIDCGAPRPPGQPLSAEQKAMVRRKLEELGLTGLAVAQSGD